jgi:hypothetical protein
MGAKQDVPLPPVRIEVEIEPHRVSPEGVLTYVWRVVSAKVGGEADVPPQVADGMRAEVAVIEHLSGSASVNAQGLSEDLTVDADALATVATLTRAGATGQMVEQVCQTLRDVAAPLPTEPIGRGARWEKLSQLGPKRIAQSETFALLDLQDRKGTLSDVLAQTAPAQSLRAPGMPQGARARMESMLASGNATVSFDLSRLVSQTHFDGTTTMVVSGQPPGDTARRVTMIMRLGIEIKGAAR